MKKEIHKVIHNAKRFTISHKHSIIVSGLGRSGTTLLYNSLIQNHFFQRMPFMATFSEIFEYDITGLAFKTHAYPPETLDKHFKLVYLFGNPYNTILSTHRRINEWGKLHHEHLGSKDFKPNDSILYEDTFHLINHFDKWYKKQNYSFITIKYEYLYDKNTLDELSTFLGFKVKLFPQRLRKTNWQNHPLGKIVEQTYKELYEKINSAENVKIWSL